MPIYEFKCLKCEEFFEILVMGKKANEDEEIKCPKCGEQSFERVLSTTNYVNAGGGGGKAEGVSEQTRTCSGGSCSTYTIPGLSRD